MGTTSQGREPQKQNPKGDATASGGSITPAPAAEPQSAPDPRITVELVATGPGRFEGEVADGSFTVLSLDAATFDALGEPDEVRVTIEAAE